MAAPNDSAIDGKTLDKVSSRHRLRLVIIALSAAAAVAGTFFIFAQSGSETTTTQSVAATLRVPGMPNAIAVGPDALWAGLNEGPTQTHGTLARLDLATGAIRKSVSLPGVLTAAVRIDKSVWVEHAGDWNDSKAGTLAQLDWMTGAVQNRLPFKAPLFGLASGNGALFVIVGREPATLVRIELDGTKVAVGEPIVIDPNRVIGLAYGEGAAWATGFESGTLIRIDPTTGSKQSVKVGDMPVGVTVAGGSVWVASRGQGTVMRVDPKSMRVLDTIDVGENPTFLAATAGSVWVANQTDGTVTRIDTGTGKTVGEPIRIAPKPPSGNSDEAGGGAAAYSFAATGDSVWVTSLTQRTVSRIDPTR